MTFYLLWSFRKMEVQWGSVAGNPTRILTIYLYTLRNIGSQFPPSSVRFLTAEHDRTLRKLLIHRIVHHRAVPGLKDTSSIQLVEMLWDKVGHRWIGDEKIMVDQCWSSFSSLIYIYILILPFEDVRVPFLDKPRCWSSSVSVIGLGHSCTGRCGNPAPAAWALSRRFPYKISDGLAWMIECLEVHGSCNDSTAFCSTFLWNCLYSAF